MDNSIDPAFFRTIYNETGEYLLKTDPKWQIEAILERLNGPEPMKAIAEYLARIFTQFHRNELQDNRRAATIESLKTQICELQIEMRFQTAK